MLVLEKENSLQKCRDKGPQATIPTNICIYKIYGRLTGIHLFTVSLFIKEAAASNYIHLQNKAIHVALCTHDTG